MLEAKAMSGMYDTKKPVPHRTILCVALLAFAGIVAPAQGQATMRPQNQQNPTSSPATPGQSQSAHHSHGIRHHHLNQPRFSYKFGTHRRSRVVYQSGGLTFVTGSGSFWHGTGPHGVIWCDGGMGWTTIGLAGPQAVYYGSSGLRQIGPTFDQLRTFVPATPARSGQTIAPEPPPEPTLEERLLSAMNSRDYDEAQTLARQQGDGRLEAFALLGRGQADEAADLLARAYRRNPELYNEPLRAEAIFANRNETRRLLGLAVRNAHRENTAEAWFLVSTIMRAEGRDRLADDMMDRARDAERQQRGVVPREPAPQPATPVPTPTPPPTPPAPTDPDMAPEESPEPDTPAKDKPTEDEPVVR